MDNNNKYATEKTEMPSSPPAYEQQAYPQQGYPNQGQPNYAYSNQAFPHQGHPAHQGHPTQQGFPLQQGVPHAPGQHQQFTNVIIQQPLTVTQPPVQPADQMVGAILVTLFCFWPTGIVAIMRASAARDAWSRGEYAKANSMADSARKMIRISVIVGVLAIVFCVVPIIIVNAVVLSSSTVTYSSNNRYND